MNPLLHYKVYPSAQHPAETQSLPLVILHGLLGSMDNWRSQATRLSASRTVITVDLRNHGHSPHLNGMSYREMAADIIDVLAHENLTKIHLLGHSMGGKVAMTLALNNPDMVEKLLVVDIAPKTYPLWHQKVLAAMLETPLSSLQSRQAVDQHLAQFIVDDVERIFLLKNLHRREAGGYEWRCNLTEIAKGYLKIAAFPSSDQAFMNECCFIRGENSHYVSHTDFPSILSLFPHAHIETVAGSGHLPHIEQADIFYYLVNDFLWGKSEIISADNDVKYS